MQLQPDCDPQNDEHSLPLRALFHAQKTTGKFVVQPRRHGRGILPEAKKWNTIQPPEWRALVLPLCKLPDKPLLRVMLRGRQGTHAIYVLHVQHGRTRFRTRAIHATWRSRTRNVGKTGIVHSRLPTIPDSGQWGVYNRNSNHTYAILCRIYRYVRRRGKLLMAQAHHHRSPGQR